MRRDRIWVGNGEHTETVGLIFYPGGKVEADAYIPLLAACNDYDIFCVMPKMPFRLAVFDIHAADDLRESYTNIERWYIGGHHSADQWRRRISQTTAARTSMKG